MILLADSTDPTTLSPNEAIGQIESPPGTEVISAAAKAENGATTIGIIYFLSNMLVLASVVAGIWALVNVILAGYKYVASNGDASTHEQVRHHITNSIFGLVLIAATYTLGGLIGYIFFGDASFILNPTLPSP